MSFRRRRDDDDDEPRRVPYQGLPAGVGLALQSFHVADLAKRARQRERCEERAAAERLELQAAGLWAVEDVARFLVLPLRTVYRLARRGEVPRFKDRRGRVRFRPAEVEAWALAHRRGPAGEP